MKMIKNGYCDNYYLTEDGKIYNSETNEYKEADKEHKFYLKTNDGKRKKITLKNIYRLVYGKTYSKDDIKDLENETWREIDNTNGLYLVSNMGRIKSYKGYKAKVLKPYKTPNGYLRVDIVQDNIRVSRLIHRLVAYSFLPSITKSDMELHHIDMNINNNKSSNLIWLTKIEHIKMHRKGEK